MDDKIYLDNSATTRPYAEVVEYMNHIAYSTYGNPSSLHKLGIDAEKVIEKARYIISNSLKVDPFEIIFTSGGTESNNMLIKGYLDANKRKGNHIIASSIEHPSVLQVFKFLENNGYVVDYIDVDSNGIIKIDHLKSKIRLNTTLISIMHVNNEVGSIQPLEQIINIKNSINKNIILHVDAVQAYGKINILPRTVGIDLMSISSHKIHGPKGVGAAYIRKGIRISPSILGGGQELSMRSGTQNVPGICGFGLAAQLAFSSLLTNWETVTNLKKLFLEQAFAQIDNVYNASSEGSPYILTLCFPKIQAEVLLHHLEQESIFVSSGSACSSRKNTYSHVLKAMHLSPNLLKGAIRFSFSHFNTASQISTAVQCLTKIVKKLS